MWHLLSRQQVKGQLCAYLVHQIIVCKTLTPLAKNLGASQCTTQNKDVVYFISYEKRKEMHWKLNYGGRVLILFRINV